ncbi:MAG: thioredoxin [Bacteroidales bacterium]|nr:thioredoxin [Bacteroidales bacterium]MBN2818274.1 thioredoxin [Bacteroidales bacterium]
MKGNFNKLINSETPVLIDFSAEWCQPCKVQAPILKDIAVELGNKIRVVKIDVDQNREIASRYQIQGVPTLAVYKNGNMVYRQSGVHQKTQLLSILQPHLSDR